MGLPNPGMTFTPFDPLPASDLNDIVENIDALQNWSAYTAATLPGSLIAADAITSRLIDWAATGAGNNGGIWWEELGRTTLSVAGDTINVTGIPARKYLKIFIFGTPTGGTIDFFLRFNGDTAGNYARRISDNGGADNTGGVSQVGLALDSGSIAQPQYAEISVINVLAQEKQVQSAWTSQGTAGAANIGSRRTLTGKWANTAAQISSVQVVNIGGSGDFAIGSECVVIGHN